MMALNSAIRAGAIRPKDLRTLVDLLASKIKANELPSYVGREMYNVLANK